MDSFFSEVGISALDFIQISTGFFLTMAVFFETRGKKHFLSNFLLVAFVLQCILFILFHKGFRVKVFAAMMLISTVIVQAVVRRRRKLEAPERSAAE